MRCMPHSGVRSPAMSSMRGSLGSACTVSARYEKPFGWAHWASTKRGRVTNGVVIGRFSGTTQSGLPALKIGRVAPFVGKADQQPRALRVADQQHAAPLTVVGDVVLPGVDHVAVGERAVGRN